MNRFTLSYFNPLQGLDEPRLLSYINEGERGAYATLQWLYRYIEKRNATARAVKRRLLSSLGGLDWDIKMADIDDDSEKQSMAERQGATLRAAYDRIGNLRAALEHLALAELRGFAHLEKIYRGKAENGNLKAENGEVSAWDVVELRVVDQWFWVRDGLYGRWQYNRDARQGAIRGETIDLRHWIIREIDDPADEIIARLHVRQETNDADWDGFLEDYGVPPMFVEGPPNVPPDKEAEYQSMAEKALSGARGYLPNGSRLHTPSATGSGGAGIFRERLEYLDGQIVIAGTSGKLTILSESGSGTLAGEAQKEAFDEVAQAIAEKVSESMQKQFDAAILQKAHPGEPALAYFAFGRVDEEDTSRVIDDVVKLSGAGFAMDAEEVSERTGYKLASLAKVEGGRMKAEGEEMAAAPGVEEDATGGPPIAAREPRALPEENVARALRVTPEFVAPAKGVVDRLLAEAQREDLSDEELLAAAQEMIDTLPDLALQTDVTGVADALQRAMEEAVEETLG